jgi:hypothetical protein
LSNFGVDIDGLEVLGLKSSRLLVLERWLIVLDDGQKY